MERVSLQVDDRTGANKRKRLISLEMYEHPAPSKNPVNRRSAEVSIFKVRQSFKLKVSDIFISQASEADGGVPTYDLEGLTSAQGRDLHLDTFTVSKKRKRSITPGEQEVVPKKRNVCYSLISIHSLYPDAGMFSQSLVVSKTIFDPHPLRTQSPYLDHDDDDNYSDNHDENDIAQRMESSSLPPSSAPSSSFDDNLSSSWPGTRILDPHPSRPQSPSLDENDDDGDSDHHGINYVAQRIESSPLPPSSAPSSAFDDDLPSIWLKTAAMQREESNAPSSPTMPINSFFAETPAGGSAVSKDHSRRQGTRKPQASGSHVNLPHSRSRNTILLSDADQPAVHSRYTSTPLAGQPNRPVQQLLAQFSGDSMGRTSDTISKKAPESSVRGRKGKGRGR